MDGDHDREHLSPSEVVAEAASRPDLTKAAPDDNDSSLEDPPSEDALDRESPVSHQNYFGTSGEQPLSKRQSLLLFATSAVLVGVIISLLWIVFVWLPDSSLVPDGIGVIFTVATSAMALICGLTIYSMRMQSLGKIRLQGGALSALALAILWLANVVLASLEAFLFFPFFISLFEVVACILLFSSFALYLYVPRQSVEMIE